MGVSEKYRIIFQIDLLSDERGLRLSTSEIKKSIFMAYEGESKASIRLSVFSELAEEEGYPKAAMLFRAIAAAAAVHARNNLRLLGTLQDTQNNLSYSLDTGTKSALTMYESLLAIAEADGNAHAAEIFDWMIKAEQEHAEFYRAVSEDASPDKPFSLSVCDVCGYIINGPLPEMCPVCGRPASNFVHIV